MVFDYLIVHFKSPRARGEDRGPGRAGSSVRSGTVEPPMNPERQHDLGQWYTPETVAALTLSLALPEVRSGSLQLVDPACGDGVFNPLTEDCELMSAPDNATCAAGCVLDCDEGFYDCNDDPLDGCETHVAADHLNCGVCGRDCGGLEGSCVNGQCQPLHSRMQSQQHSLFGASA